MIVSSRNSRTSIFKSIFSLGTSQRSFLCFFGGNLVFANGLHVTSDYGKYRLHCPPPWVEYLSGYLSVWIFCAVRLFFLTIGAIFSSYRGLIVGVHRLFLRSFFFPRVCPGADYLLRYLFFCAWISFPPLRLPPTLSILTYLSIRPYPQFLLFGRFFFFLGLDLFFLNIPLHFLRILLFFSNGTSDLSYLAVLLGFIQFYSVLLGFIGFSWVFLGFTRFDWIIKGFYCI